MVIVFYYKNIENRKTDFQFVNALNLCTNNYFYVNKIIYDNFLHYRFCIINIIINVCNVTWEIFLWKKNLV